MLGAGPTTGGAPDSSASAAEAGENARELERVKAELKKQVLQFRPESRASTPNVKTRAEAKNWKTMEGQQARKKLAQLEKKLQQLQRVDNELRSVNCSVAGDDASPSFETAWSSAGRSGTGDSDFPKSTSNGHPLSKHSSTVGLSTPNTGVLKTSRTSSANGQAVGSATEPPASGTGSSGSRTASEESARRTASHGSVGLRSTDRNASTETRPYTSQSAHRSVRADDPFSDPRPTTSPSATRLGSTTGPGHTNRLVVDDDDRPPDRRTSSRGRRTREGSPYSKGNGLGSVGESPLRSSGESPFRSAWSPVRSIDGHPDQGYVSIAELREVLREMRVEDNAGLSRTRSQSSSGRPLEHQRASGETENGKDSAEAPAIPIRNEDQDSEAGSEKVAEIKSTKQTNMVPKTLSEATAISCPILLGGLSRHSPVRMKCFQIYQSTRWQTLFLGVTLANSIYIASSPETAADPQTTEGVDFLKIFDFFCVGVLLFEVIVSIIAFGFAGDPSTWLRNSDLHKFDFAVICVTIFEYVAAYFGIRGLTLRPFRLLRVFKAMVQLRTFANVKAIITTLRSGLGQLLVVFAMLLFFIAAFAVFGMAIFQNSFRRRCVALDHHVPSCASDFSTGWGASCDFTNLSETTNRLGGELIVSPGYPGYFLCKILKNTTAGQYDGEYPLDPYGRYHTCKEWQMCEVLENPQMGQQHFDHIGGAMITIFQIAAPDGSYDVIWNSLQSEPQVFEAIWVFYFCISCLCTFLLLGLFVAVVTGTFKRVRETQSQRFMSKMLNGENEGEEAAAQQGDATNAAPEAEEAELDALGNRMEKHRSQVLRSSTFVLQNRVADLEAQEKETEIHDDNIPVEQYAMHLFRSKTFVHFMSAVIVVHCLAMAADQYNAPKTWNDYANVTYVVANAIFLCELLLRFVAFGSLRYFWAASMNQSELLITLCGTLGLIMNSPFLIRIPALRLYRLMRYIPTLQALLFSAVSSTRAILNLVIFIAVVAVCFAVAGRYIFQHRMDEVTRSNFGSFTQALLTVFQLLTGDSWSGVLFSAMSVMTTIYGTVFAAVFIMSWFIFSRLIVTNLFVAVIIENFEVSETIENIRKPGYLSNVRGLFRKAGLQLYVFQLNLRGKQVKLDKSGNLVYKNKMSSTLSQMERRKSSLVHHHHHKAAGLLHSAGDEHSMLRRNRSTFVTGANKNQFNTVWGGGGHFGFASLIPGRQKDEAGQTKKTQDGVEMKEGVTLADAPADAIGEPAKEEDADSQTTASFYDPHVSPLNDIIEDVGNLPHYLDLVKQVLPAGKWNQKVVEEQDDGTVLGCISPSHPVHRFCEWLSEQVLFDVIIYTAILGGCFFLVITPPYEDMPWQQALIDFETMALWNRVFTIIFSVEFFTRVMSKGLLFTKNAYLKSGWNVMDSLVLFFAWIDEFNLVSGGGVAKVMRLARALRPLRLMKRNQGMRIVIDALISTLAPVAYVVVFSMFTFMVFSLVGIGLFGGMLFRCSSPGAEWPGGLVECSGYHVRDNGIVVPRAWVSPPHNFDSFYNAMFTLFRVNTLKYVAVVTDSMDITDFQKSPKEGYSMYYSVFFIIYLVVGALFVMNLFVGFIVDGFNANKGSTQADLQFNRFVRSIAEHKPKYERFAPPTNAFSTALRGLVASRAFQVVSVTCVFLNVVFMMTEHADATDEFKRFMDTQNLVFFIELCVELVIFFFAFGPGGFWNDPWKAFDFFVAIGSMVGYIQDNPRATQFARTFRLMRVIRLMKMIGPIRIILETLLASLPQLVNVVLLLFLVYSMFAVVAVQTFGTTRYGTRLGPTANFETYGNAMFTLYQMVTGDEWNLIMDDCSIEPPNCLTRFVNVDENGNPTGYEGVEYSFGDCGSYYAGFFFVVFVIVCESVMLNLFIGMILDNFSFITDDVAEIEDANWDTGASSGQIIGLANIFKQHDSGTSLCAISGIHFLMSVMPQPLGFRSQTGKLRYGPAERAAEKLIRAELNLIVRQGYEEDRHVRKVWWRRLFPLLFMPAPKALSQSVTFEELLLTLLYWRKPAMVPAVVKAARVGVINEVVVLAHALTLKDMLLGPVAAMKQRQTRRALKPRATFVRWSQQDQHFARRFLARAAVLHVQRVNAERKGVWRQFRVVPPVRTLALELIPFDALPPEFVAHQQVVQKDLHIKFAKPAHAIHALKSQVHTNAVAMRFVDARNKDNIGIVGLDLSKVDWEGWEETLLRDDTIFRPKTRRNRVDEPQPSWTKVDLRMRTWTEKKHELASDADQDRTSFIASVLDIQGFVIKEDSPKEKYPLYHSKLRFNLGLFAEAANLTGAARFGFGRVPPCYDGCMEVLGYIPFDALLLRTDELKQAMLQDSPRRILPENMLGADSSSLRPRRLLPAITQDVAGRQELEDADDSVHDTNAA